MASPLLEIAHLQQSLIANNSHVCLDFYHYQNSVYMHQRLHISNVYVKDQRQVREPIGLIFWKIDFLEN